MSLKKNTLYFLICFSLSLSIISIGNYPIVFLLFSFVTPQLVVYTFALLGINVLRHKITRRRNYLYMFPFLVFDFYFMKGLIYLLGGHVNFASFTLSDAKYLGIATLNHLMYYLVFVYRKSP